MKDWIIILCRPSRHENWQPILFDNNQGAKLQYGHVPLYTRGDDANAKQFRSLHAVQRHMADTRQCRMIYDNNEQEYAQFYDYGNSEDESTGRWKLTHLLSLIVILADVPFLWQSITCNLVFQEKIWLKLEILLHQQHLSLVAMNWCSLHLTVMAQKFLGRESLHAIIASDTSFQMLAKALLWTQCCQGQSDS